MATAIYSTYKPKTKDLASIPLLGGQFEYSPRGGQDTPGEMQMGKQLNKQYNTQVLLSNKLSEYSVPL